MALVLQCMQAVFFSQEADAAGTQEISIYFGKMALQPLLWTCTWIARCECSVILITARSSRFL